MTCGTRQQHHANNQLGGGTAVYLAKYFLFPLFCFVLLPLVFFIDIYIKDAKLKAKQIVISVVVIKIKIK
jgi:hypothetical protein